MSVIVCARCGRTTNTALCDWIDRKEKDGQANHCYAAYVDDKWVKGCGYDKIVLLSTRCTVDGVIGIRPEGMDVTEYAKKLMKEKKHGKEKMGLGEKGRPGNRRHDKKS